MRILHISTRLILGGSQENTVLSCEGQVRAGHVVDLAFGPIYGPEGSLLARVQEFRTPDGRGIVLHEVPNLIRDVQLGADRRCLRELKQLIRERRPDVVHTHSSKAGILGRAAAWSVLHKDRRPIGIVHTIHGPPFHAFQSKVKNLMYIAAERFAARRCHRIVSVADAMTSQYLSRCIGRPEQYRTVYSGMEVESFLNARHGEKREDIRAALSLSDQDFVIGTVARLAELKGHDDILDALGEDLRRHPNWKLLWVGDGWWRDRLLARIRALSLRTASAASPDPVAQVIFTGLVPSERVPVLMRAMDVLVHPSYREGLPRTVPQALLCGVPVIANDADGTCEVCIDDRTGRLVEPGDLGDLVDAVRWMAEHPDERRAMALRGRDMCKSRFPAEIMVGHLEAVYRDAIREAEVSMKL